MHIIQYASLNETHPPLLSISGEQGGFFKENFSFNILLKIS